MEIIHTVRSKLQNLVSKMERMEQAPGVVQEGIHKHQRSSARNLIHYLSLRSEDIRQLQDHLHILGLSSLASSESHILRQVQSVLQRLGEHYSDEQLSPLDYRVAQQHSQRNTSQLFGKAKPGVPFVMVTLDKKFSLELDAVQKLIEAGMNVARINCAHDNKDIWLAMVDVVNLASEHVGLPCKIYMDLAGPKMRTTMLGTSKNDRTRRLFEGQYITFAEADAHFDPDTTVIGCQEAGVVDQLSVGERVLFDDGVMEAVVALRSAGIATLKIVRISSKKFRLSVQKGLNFPDTQLLIPSLTDVDRSIIPFICKHADLVGYSFVRTAEDLAALQAELQVFENRPEIILKIETSEAVQNLPALLLQGMHEELFGVMIARGDLAVEIGFERMSEIQEEILWICEAAHVPVIWATQVLETLNKKGIATRSEVTDASHAVMAECVLLNKGKYTIRVIETLRDILSRSGSHHVKKRYTMRPMQIAKHYFSTHHHDAGQVES